MPRNRSEKNPEPSLEGVSDWVLEPVRLDAKHGQPFQESSAGNNLYAGWEDDRKMAYDDISEGRLRSFYHAYKGYLDAKKSK